MKQSVYPARVVFHANEGVIATLKAKATNEGITLSEVMRRAARRELEAA